MKLKSNMRSITISEAKRGQYLFPSRIVAKEEDPTNKE